MSQELDVAAYDLAGEVIRRAWRFRQYTDDRTFGTQRRDEKTAMILRLCACFGAKTYNEKFSERLQTYEKAFNFMMQYGTTYGAEVVGAITEGAALSPEQSEDLVSSFLATFSLPERETLKGDDEAPELVDVAAPDCSFTITRSALNSLAKGGKSLLTKYIDGHHETREMLNHVEAFAATDSEREQHCVQCDVDGMRLSVARNTLSHLRGRTVRMINHIWTAPDGQFKDICFVIC